MDEVDHDQDSVPLRDIVQATLTPREYQPFMCQAAREDLAVVGDCFFG